MHVSGSAPAPATILVLMALGSFQPVTQGYFPRPGSSGSGPAVPGFRPGEVSEPLGPLGCPCRQIPYGHTTMACSLEQQQPMLTGGEGLPARRPVARSTPPQA